LKALIFSRHHLLTKSLEKKWCETWRQKAAIGGNEFAAICCNGVWKFAALCRLTTPAVAAICRIRGLISSHFNFHLLPTTIFRHRVMLSGDD
jgi:hypothetical protein